MPATLTHDRHLTAARRLFEHVGEAAGVPVSIKLWAGSRVPLGPVGDSPFAIAISGPGVIGSMLRRPTLENFVRHYACGNIDVEGGDLIEFVRTARRAPGMKKRVRSLSKLRVLKEVWPFL